VRKNGVSEGKEGQGRNVWDPRKYGKKAGFMGQKERKPEI
jgi:hypothetical protein